MVDFPASYVSLLGYGIYSAIWGIHPEYTQKNHHQSRNTLQRINTFRCHRVTWNHWKECIPILCVCAKTSLDVFFKRKSCPRFHFNVLLFQVMSKFWSPMSPCLKMHPMNWLVDQALNVRELSFLGIGRDSLWPLCNHLLGRIWPSTLLPSSYFTKNDLFFKVGGRHNFILFPNQTIDLTNVTTCFPQIRGIQ